MQQALGTLSKLPTFERIFAVVHNKHDADWVGALIDRNQRVFKRCVAIFLSKDMYEGRTYLLSKSCMARLFVPTVLSGYRTCLQNSVSCSMSPLRLGITGQCRGGKGFASLRYFSKLVKAEEVSFGYYGWSPPGSIRSSGLFKAVNDGLLSDLVASHHRLPDDTLHQHIGCLDALIDLKVMEGDEIGIRSSGAFTLAYALQMPLIAHENSFPLFNAITYRSHEDLLDLILSGSLRSKIQEYRLRIKRERVEHEESNQRISL